MEMKSFPRYIMHYMSCIISRSHRNWAVQPQKKEGYRLKISDLGSRDLCSENKGADQFLCGYRAADLRICLAGFLMMWLITRKINQKVLL